MILWIVVLSLLVLYIVITIRRSQLLPSSNKVVLISGCDSGFGKLSALQLSSKGCTVLAGCYTNEGIQSLNAEKRSNLIPFSLDITKQKSIDDAVKLVNKYCKDQGLWALINNAGIAHGAEVDLLPLQGMRDLLEVNFFGHVAMTQALLTFIKKSKGRIINTASVAGRGIAIPRLTSYVVSKRAIEGFNDCLRIELKPWGINVIVIEPGYMGTEIFANARLLHVEWRRNIPKEKIEEYGDVYFNELESQAASRRTRKIGDPQLVSDAYTHAVLSSYPKQRYLVGTDAWLIFSWLPLVPSWLGDIIISYLSPMPVPLVLRKH